jgi:signal peptidase II
MIIYLVIIAVLIGVDQLTKMIVMNQMTLGQSIEIIPDFFYFTSVRNPGAAWGKMANQMGFFYIITLLAVGVFAYFLYKDGDLQNKKLYTISLFLIIAGALGNFIDRVIYQEVVDFIHVYIFNYNFPVFNFADIFLTLGTIGFGISVVLLGD